LKNGFKSITTSVGGNHVLVLNRVRNRLEKEFPDVMERRRLRCGQLGQDCTAVQGREYEAEHEPID
jgi:hypothetical protein